MGSILPISNIKSGIQKMILVYIILLRFTIVKSFNSTCLISDQSTQDTNKLQHQPNRFNVLVEELESCNSSTLFLITDNNVLRNAFLKAIPVSAISLPHIHFDLQIRSQKRDLRAAILESYRRLGTVTFVLVVRHPEDVMDLADSVFHEYSRNWTALMPHRTKWMVILWSPGQEQALSIQQRHSVFDNVCYVQLQQYSNPLSLILSDVSTFRWRSGRIKEPERVDPKFIGSNCRAFPNKDFGFNGRILHMLTKPYFSKIYLKLSESENKTVYTGLWIDIANILAKNLNFTYNLTVTNVSWVEYQQILSDGLTDMGLTTWTRRHRNLNINDSSGLFYFTVSGIYAKPAEQFNFQESRTYRILFSNIHLFVLMGASILLVILLYIGSNHLRILASSNLNISSNGPSGKRPISRFQKALQCFVSGINYTNLPKPHGFTAHFSLLLWQIGRAIVTIVFTSFLTASMIHSPLALPFESFQEMIDRGDYSWGVLQDISFVEFMKFSDSDLLKSLYGGISRTFDPRKENFIDDVTKLMRESRFVLIHFQESIISAMKENNIELDNFVAMREHLYHFANCFLFPGNSELNNAISEKLELLRESGIMDRLLSRYNLTSRFDETAERQSPETEPVDFEEMAFLLVLQATLIFSSLIVLLCEGILSACGCGYNTDDPQNCVSENMQEQD